MKQYFALVCAHARLLVIMTISMLVGLAFKGQLSAWPIWIAYQTIGLLVGVLILQIIMRLQRKR